MDFIVSIPKNITVNKLDDLRILGIAERMRIVEKLKNRSVLGNADRPSVMTAGIDLIIEKQHHVSADPVLSDTWMDQIEPRIDEASAILLSVSPLFSEVFVPKVNLRQVDADKKADLAEKDVVFVSEANVENDVLEQKFFVRSCCRCCHWFVFFDDGSVCGRRSRGKNLDIGEFNVTELSNAENKVVHGHFASNRDNLLRVEKAVVVRCC